MRVDATAGRVMGIDYGNRRVGIAVSDPLRVLARGIGTWENDAHLLDRLQVLVDAEQVSLIVVGMPYAPDGGLGAQAREVEKFIARVRAVIAVPVETWDESRTSADARAALHAGGIRRKQRREKGRIDEMAARILLQQYLDAHQTQERPH